MQAPEASPLALRIINADFLKTAKTDLPKGIFSSFSAILDSIPFSINSRKKGEKKLLPSTEKLVPCPAA